MISKRTFKKVVSRQCHGLLSRALEAFIPRRDQPEDSSRNSQIHDVRSNLVPHSVPISSPATESFIGLAS